MPELRRDPITGRWMIIAVEEGKHPADFEVEKHILKGGPCAFCSGNEDKTPPEIHADRPDGAGANTPGWLTRTIPNKFPALRIEGDLGRTGLGLYDMMNGVGAHEVIIETPEHDKSLADLPDSQIEKVIWAYRNRSMDLRGDKRIKYIVLFKNYGESAGASLEHPHSQLIALPIIPIRVNEELKGAEAYFEHKERCVYCDIVRQELHDIDRLVAENKSFVAFCPFASRFPFEVWITPRVHHADFSHIQSEIVVDLARLLREILLRIKRVLSDPSYNFIIHTSPIEEEERYDYHWHMEIMPRLMPVAGFEWGSGFYINPTAPESAASCLRKIRL
ncbi:MAG: galactose-1-phosphate uridylyltransferase [Candidatus Omnitrophica bacterium]|nr:galactose-1-phosphate uridylyltransferase [Candidatus Omnitrophota bacterium]